MAIEVRKEEEGGGGAKVYVDEVEQCPAPASSKHLVPGCLWVNAGMPVPNVL